MDASAGDPLRFHLIAPPYGRFEIEASRQISLQSAADQLADVLHLPPGGWWFWHVETERFLDPALRLMDHPIFLDESVVMMAGS